MNKLNKITRAEEEKAIDKATAKVAINPIQQWKVDIDCGGVPIEVKIKVNYKTDDIECSWDEKIFDTFLSKGDANAAERELLDRVRLITCAASLQRVA